jgi:hypothetical protein
MAAEPDRRPGGTAKWARAFGAFWYGFLVGDDWIIPVAVVAGLAGTYLVSRSGLAAWWLTPVVVAVVLLASLARAVRR